MENIRTLIQPDTSYDITAFIFTKKIRFQRIVRSNKIYGRWIETGTTSSPHADIPRLKLRVPFPKHLRNSNFTYVAIQPATCQKNNFITLYEGHLETKERFAIQRYLLIIGKKQNMQVLWHTFTYFST